MITNINTIELMSVRVGGIATTIQITIKQLIYFYNVNTTMNG